MHDPRGGSSPTPEQRSAARERPARSPILHQRWQDLLFLHWEWDAEEIQGRLPPGLLVDRHEGRSYLGIVPFKMRRVRPRFLPAVPGISDFLELNLRTYVHDATGLPGVWFYSLDANRRLAVALARSCFALPYHLATMDTNEEAGATNFASSRRGDPASRVRYRYRPTGPTRRAAPGSLEFFLFERYVLFADTQRGLRKGRVHHEPYPFRDVELLEWGEGLFRVNGFDPPQRAPDHAAASRGVDVSIYGTTSVDGARA